MIKRFAVIMMALVAFGACSPKEPVQNDPWLETKTEPASYEAEADTLTYDFLTESGAEAEAEVAPEPDLPVLDEAPAETVVATPPPAPEPEATMTEIHSGPLFYVQIFASSNRKSAEEIALKADTRLDQTVRILFLDPYYKVLVGGFADKDDAVVLRRDLTEIGYPDAWIFEH